MTVIKKIQQKSAKFCAHGKSKGSGAGELFCRCTSDKGGAVYSTKSDSQIRHSGFRVSSPTSRGKFSCDERIFV